MALYYVVLCCFLLVVAAAGMWLVPMLATSRASRKWCRRVEEIRREALFPPQCSTVRSRRLRAGTVYVTSSATTAQEELRRLEAAVSSLNVAARRTVSHHRRRIASYGRCARCRMPREIALSSRARRKRNRLLRPAVTY